MGIITNAISSVLGVTSDAGWEWRDHIHPASFRGVPFGVVSGEGVYGRRVAVHEYPYKDTVYVEDLGRSTRKFTIRGFLVHDSLVYSAPDVLTQRDNLIAAIEQNGNATLVHPTLGELTVYVSDGGLQITEGIESERVFEFTLTCIEAGEKEFSIQTAVSQDAQTNWQKTLYTVAARYVAQIKSEINSVAHALDMASGTISGYADLAQSLVDSVTNLGNVLESTFGNKRYSRFYHGVVGGAISGIVGIVSNQKDGNVTQLVGQTIASSVTDKETISKAIDDANDVSTIEEIPETVQEVIEEIVKSTGSDKEKINSLEKLSDFNDERFQSTPVATSVVKHTVCMLVCMSASTLTYMALQYVPFSLDEAHDILNRVCAKLDRALLMCADLGNDDCYKALLEQRIAFVNTYTARFADLSALMEVQLIAPQPSLTLANRFYQDVSRSIEIVQAAKPIHPAFMPTAFRALKQ